MNVWSIQIQIKTNQQPKLAAGDILICSLYLSTRDIYIICFQTFLCEEAQCLLTFKMWRLTFD